MFVYDEATPRLVRVLLIATATITLMVRQASVMMMNMVHAPTNERC